LSGARKCGFNLTRPARKAAILPYLRAIGDSIRFLSEKESREEWTFVDRKKILKTLFRFHVEDLADRPERQEEYLRLVPVLKAVNRIESAYRKHRQKTLGEARHV